MRVYELSTELGITSKELLSVLREKGFVVKSHMSVVEPEAAQLIRNQFKKPEPEAAKKIMQKQSVSKKTTKSPTRSSRKRSVSSDRRPSASKAVSSKKIVQEEPQKPDQVVVTPMSVGDLAALICISANELILTLLQSGIVATINQVLPAEMVEKIVRHHGIEVVSSQAPAPVLEERVASQGVGELSDRLPVIVVLGHVDHGKTTLLDRIRKTRVVAKEKGGITQHLGAYEAKTKQGNLVFLDTPGHEAFPKMRQRGIKVADIAILVVAADDGIMPQTVEAIKQIKKMNVPIVVAMNKVDKAEASRLETVKRQLAEHDLLPEEWGGQTICMPISALHGTGVDELLEMVALQAQLLELKSTKEGPARCYVLESMLEKGRGPVATLICQHGTLRVGDYFVCGKTSGRVSSMKNSYGQLVKEAESSKPIQVAGFKELPGVGDLFSVVDKSEIRKLQAESQAVKDASVAQLTGAGAINLIIKTDTNSSKEAVRDAIDRLSRSLPVPFVIVHAGIGPISEGDVELAYSTGSMVVGLHVKAESNARSLAKRRSVAIHLHDIIYKLLEQLEERSEQDKEVEMVRTKIGEAVVRKVFNIKGIGVVAGSHVQDGRFAKNGFVVAWRGRQKIGEGPITSLQRDKKTVKEVHTGFECGFVVEGIEDWQEGDRAECFIEQPKG